MKNSVTALLLAGLLAFGTCSITIAAVDIDDLLRNQRAKPDPEAEAERKRLRGLVLSSVLEDYRANNRKLTTATFVESVVAAGSEGLHEWVAGYRRKWPENGLEGNCRHGRCQGWAHDPNILQMVARSDFIKSLLEAEFSVTIPFDPESYFYPSLYFSPSRAGNCQNVYERYLELDATAVAEGAQLVLLERCDARQLFKVEPVQPKSICAAITPNLLSSGFTAIASRALKLVDYKQASYLSRAVRYYAGGNAEDEVLYLADLFKVLGAACGVEDRSLNGNKQFIESYKRLLGEFASAVDAAILLERQTALRKEDQRRQLNDQLAMESRQQERDRNNARDRERIALQSGQRKPSTIDDIRLMWAPQAGLNVVTFPPVVADNKWYELQGKLVRSTGQRHVFEVQIGRDTKYFFADIERSTILGQDTQLRFEFPATIIGRFIGVAPYSTVAGVQRMAPVFVVAFIQN